MMDLSATSWLLASILLPLLAVAGLILTQRWPNIRDGITILTSSLVCYCVWQLYQSYKIDNNISSLLFELLPGLSIGFTVEPLGLIFALIASLLWVLTSLYAIGYMRGNQEKHQTRFCCFFAIAISATLSIAYAANLFTLFICYEVLTLSTFPLVTHKGNEQAMRAGRVYLGILLGTSICLFLPAIIWVWYLTGTTDFSAGGILAGQASAWTVTLLAALFLFGIGKAAVMPVHRWLPAAMVAPTPVSALLHAVAVVKAGVFSIVKITAGIFGLDLLQATPGIDWLFYVVGFTIIMASVIALQQDNLKRRLAYSTISQLAYIVMGALVLAPLSLLAAALHIAAHAFGKITLFFAAGAIYTATKKTKVSELNGIGWQMPWTMTAFAIGTLSMIGLPPTFGFISKWYLLSGSIQAGQWLAILVIIVSTLLNTAYLLPIVYRAFFRMPNSDSKSHGEAPFIMVLALSTTAVLTVLFFFWPDIPFALAQDFVQKL